jgi:hypothetical protein
MENPNKGFEMKKKIEEAKAWTREHKDELIGYGFVAGVIGFYVTVFTVAVKQQQAYNRQEAAKTAAIQQAIRESKSQTSIVFIDSDALMEAIGKVPQ